MSTGNHHDYSNRIELLRQFRQAGERALECHSDQARFRNSTYQVFAKRLTRAYWDRAADVIQQQHPEEDVFELIERHVGIHRGTAKRWQSGETIGTFAAYLSTVHVFQLAWDKLEVADRRELVIEAMCDALTIIRQKLAASSQPSIDSPESHQTGTLSRDHWEFLRQVHLSKDWLAAVAECDESRRHPELLRVADSILKRFRSETDRSESPQLDGHRLVALVRDWHQAWTMFFAIVPCRWRF